MLSQKQKPAQPGGGDTSAEEFTGVKRQVAKRDELVEQLKKESRKRTTKEEILRRCGCL